MPRGDKVRRARKLVQEHNRVQRPARHRPCHSLPRTGKCPDHLGCPFTAPARLQDGPEGPGAGFWEFGASSTPRDATKERLLNHRLRDCPSGRLLASTPRRCSATIWHSSLHILRRRTPAPGEPSAICRQYARAPPARGAPTGTFLSALVRQPGQRNFVESSPEPHGGRTGVIRLGSGPR